MSTRCEYKWHIPLCGRNNVKTGVHPLITAPYPIKVDFYANLRIPISTLVWKSGGIWFRAYDIRQLKPFMCFSPHWIWIRACYLTVTKSINTTIPITAIWFNPQSLKRLRRCLEVACRSIGWTCGLKCSYEKVWRKIMEDVDSPSVWNISNGALLTMK